jgi:signal transduction histidine kinase
MNAAGRAHRFGGWSRRVAVVGPPLVILLFVLLLAGMMRQRRDSTVRLQHSQLVAAELQQLAGRVVDAETGQRGFLITGDSAFLAPYFGAARDVDRRLIEVRALLAGDEPQLAALAEVERQVRSRFGILDGVLALRERAGVAAAHEDLRRRAGLDAMAGLRAAIDVMLEREARRTAVLAAAQERYGRLVLWSFLVGAAVVLGVALLTNRVFDRHLDEQQRLNDELSDANTRLQEQAVELELQADEMQAQTVQLEETAVELESSNEELQGQRAQLELLSGELAATNDELRRANVTLELRSREAESANRAKSEFLAAMSHELRTPLNAIAGYADLIELGIYGAAEPQQRAALERIKHNARHLLLLITDILQFAKIEAGRIEVRREPVPLGDLLTETEQVLEPLLRSKGVAYQAAAAAAGVSVVGDRDRIRQILLNLVTNAAKYTESGGQVVIHADADDGRVRIRVRDTGIGIHHDQQALIFDPFVQLHRTRGAQSDGVGLGLSISRELARAMAGELEVESEPGTGSTFTLTLARAVSADA